MKHTKSWSYAAVTKKAEKQINDLMDASRNMVEPEPAFTYRQWAYGVFLAWNDLTMGWQNEGDSERMEALTRRPDE